MTEREQLAYTVEQAADVCGVSEKYIRDQIARGEIEKRHVGRKILIRRADLEAWLNDLPRERSAG